MAKKTPLKKAKETLWALCREITRAQYSNTCYTCDKHGLTGGNFQTGHFIPSSISSVELRYSLDNLRPQCYHCNINLSGNWPAFEERLIFEKGVNFVSELKQRNRSTKGKKYDLQWYLTKIEEYQNLLK